MIVRCIQLLRFWFYQTINIISKTHECVVIYPSKPQTKISRIVVSFTAQSLWLYIPPLSPGRKLPGTAWHHQGTRCKSSFFSGDFSWCLNWGTTQNLIFIKFKSCWTLMFPVKTATWSYTQSPDTPKYVATAENTMALRLLCLIVHAMSVERLEP